MLVLPATVAYAGFFSFFGSIFTKVAIEDKPINSQNIALLAAVGGPDLGQSTASDVNIVGGGAILPDAGPNGGLADVSTDDFDHGQISIYVVHAGDSLSSIAKMFGVSVNTILWANNMPQGSVLKIGQSLVILPVTGVQYVVAKGDTIASIAKKYHGDPEEIYSYNGLSADATLDVGSIVIIPDGEMPGVPKPTTVSATSKLRNAGGPSYAGYYSPPLTNYRISQGLHGYNGVDLVSYDGPGAYVMAAAAGTVIVARSGGYNGGYGNYVVIQHNNGTQTLYGHLKSLAISQGATVAQGQLIGYEGTTGRSTGPHLHFEVRGAKNPFAP